MVATNSRAGRSGSIRTLLSTPRQYVGSFAPFCWVVGRTAVVNLLSSEEFLVMCGDGILTGFLFLFPFVIVVAGALVAILPPLVRFLRTGLKA